MNRQKREGQVLSTGVSRDQLITRGDLEDFKSELIFELKNIVLDANAPVRKKWMRSSEIKKSLGISGGTLQTLRTNGRLPYTKIGGIFFYSVDAIEEALQKGVKK